MGGACSQEFGCGAEENADRDGTNTEDPQLNLLGSFLSVPYNGENEIDRLISPDSTCGIVDLNATQKEFIKSAFKNTTTNNHNNNNNNSIDHGSTNFRFNEEHQHENENDYENECESYEIAHETGEPVVTPVTSVSQPVSRRSTTVRKINENIINGWKDAIKTGNDSLCLTMYGDYKDNRESFISCIFENGDNSLHVACQLDSDDIKLAFWLLKHCKMDVNCINNKNGKTPLHYACLKRNHELVSLLLFKFFANPSIKDKNGKTAMDIAKSKKYKSFKIQKLIRRATNTTVKRVRNRSHSRMPSNEEAINDINEILNTNNNSRRNSISISNSDISISIARETRLSDSKEMELSKLTKRNPFRNKKIALPKRHDPIARANEIFWQKKNSLPKLNSFLKKRQPTIPFIWQVRCLAVIDDYIIWNDTKIDISNRSNSHSGNNNNNINNSNKSAIISAIISETDVTFNAKNLLQPILSVEDRMKFNGNLKMSAIYGISTHSKLINLKQGEYKDRCFVINARNKNSYDGTTREYIWKCQDKKERDFWIKGLNQHMAFYKQAEKYDII